MKSLLLIGCGGHSRALIDLIERQGQWKIQGLVGLPEQIGTTVLGHQVIGSDSDLPALRQHCCSALLAMGQLPDPTLRQRLAALLQALRFEFPRLVSPYAVVSRHAQLGPGTTVAHGSIVNPGAHVGEHCIINSRALIEHDAVIEDYCHISTGALVNGGVHIGPGSFIGSGAMIREGLNLPASTVISAGKRVMGWPLLHKS